MEETSTQYMSYVICYATLGYQDITSKQFLLWVPQPGAFLSFRSWRLGFILQSLSFLIPPSFRYPHVSSKRRLEEDDGDWAGQGKFYRNLLMGVWQRSFAVVKILIRPSNLGCHSHVSSRRDRLTVGNKLGSIFHCSFEDGVSYTQKEI